MQINVRFVRLPVSRVLERRAVERLRAAFARFAGEITSITVRIADLNGPKGGVDKRLTVALHARSLPTIAVEQRSDNAYIGLDQAIERVETAAARAYQRLRQRVQGRRA